MNRQREILDTTKCINISIMEPSEGTAIEYGTEKILKEIMAGNYQWWKTLIYTSRKDYKLSNYYL